MNMLRWVGIGLWLAVKLCVKPVINYLWAMACMPQEVRNIRHNDLRHMQDDIDEVKEEVRTVKRQVDTVKRDQAEQTGICKATREALGLRTQR